MKLTHPIQLITAAGLTVLGGGNTSAQHPVDSFYTQNAENQGIADNAQKLSKAVAEGKDGKSFMKSMVGTAHGQYNREIKGRHTVNPSYRYATIFTPTELGRDHAIIVDPANETLVVFQGVETKADGKLNMKEATVASMYAKDIKLTDDEAKKRVSDAALHTIDNAQAALTASFEQRQKAAVFIKR